MSSDDDMLDHELGLLTRLAGAGVAVAERLGQVLQAADGVEDLVQVSDAFHHAARGVRQTIALKARLRREARRPAPAPQQVAPAPAPAQPSERGERGESGERPEQPDWYERHASLGALDLLLETHGLDSEAVQDAISAAVARIRRDIAAAEAVLPGDPGAPEDRESDLSHADTCVVPAAPRITGSSRQARSAPPPRRDSG
ncbi:MAG: hypothetical protein DI570_15375 [Phenylobacterium zucineum]|nr:MAG: hypothetical protein DI570_15375 [Phenylobacterium zucineum]